MHCQSDGSTMTIAFPVALTDCDYTSLISLSVSTFRNEAPRCSKGAFSQSVFGVHIAGRMHPIKSEIDALCGLRGASDQSVLYSGFWGFTMLAAYVQS
jgi:hypothetical protein